jgi:hypothetical protein
MDLAVSGRDLARQGELVAFAEAHGFSGAWVSEVNGADAISQATAIVGATKQMRVGTAIIPIQTRDPLLMAMTAYSLAELSGDRFVLGLGTSTKVIVEDWHGRAWGKPLSGTREYVGLVRELLQGEKVSASGAFPMRRASLAARGQHSVPIFLAAVILNFVSTRQVERSVGTDSRNAACGWPDPCVRGRGLLQGNGCVRSVPGPAALPARDAHLPHVAGLSEVLLGRRLGRTLRLNRSTLVGG